MPAAVNERSAAASRMAREHPMLEALIAGTRAMREAGEAALPKFPNEDPPSWAQRRDTATLFPAYRRTVTVMAGKPFSKPLTLDPAADPEIVKWALNIDREGVDLHTFAAEMLDEAIAYGLCGILVEAPKHIAPDGRPISLAEEKAADIRPYFVRVMHNQILGWRVTTEGGVRRLAQLRIEESVDRADGPFGDVEVKRVRVLEPGSWSVYEEVDTNDGKEWLLVESGLSGLDVIPFVPCYGRRTGLLEGTSPLIDLAFLNIKHWQSQSDQDTILHVARVPILAMIGGEAKTELTVGSASAVKLPSGADLKFVEHSGAAIEAGAKSLADLEDQMIQSGAELLVKKPGARSATESANDAEANKCDLQRIVEGFEGSLDQALALMARYASRPAAAKAMLYKDFGAANLSEASGQLILQMQQSGLISKPTAIAELKRRGELSPEVDAAEEGEAVDTEGPGLGTMIDAVVAA